MFKNNQQIFLFVIGGLFVYYVFMRTREHLEIPPAIPRNLGPRDRRSRTTVAPEDAQPIRDGITYAEKINIMKRLQELESKVH